MTCSMKQNVSNNECDDAFYMIVTSSEKVSRAGANQGLFFRNDWSFSSSMKHCDGLSKDWSNKLFHRYFIRKYHHEAPARDTGNGNQLGQIICMD